MADDQQFCLRWNNFHSNFTSQFKALRVEEDFVDVTLACEGKQIKAHKLVLSACSPYFKDLFKENPCKHPIVFMHDMEYEQLMNLVEFMYAGQVNVCQNKLPAFLRTAESLQIRGLTQSQNKLLQSPERKVFDLGQTGLMKKEVVDQGSRTSSPVDSLLEEGSYPLPSSKRICVSFDSAHPNRESTSFTEVPTTALIETKMEPMDYCSDGEVKPQISNSLLPNSHLVNRTGYSLQGVLDTAANMPAQRQDTSQEDVVGEMCKPHSLEPPPASDPLKPHSLDPRPCPECGRIYSNISNLRQHIRLIHHPECITCPLCFKPFKNKLYLRRHVMSYHEISLPSQNDMRYKYTGLLSNVGKREGQEGIGETQKVSPEIASLLSSLKNDNPQHSVNYKHNAIDKRFTAVVDTNRTVGSKSLTEPIVPNSL